MIEDVYWLSLYGIVGTILVICVEVLELESHSPVSVTDHVRDGVWWLFSCVHHCKTDLSRDVHLASHLKAFWKIGILHQIDMEYPLVVASISRDAELLLVRFRLVDVTIELRVLLDPVGGHKLVVERRRLYGRHRSCSSRIQIDNWKPQSSVEFMTATERVQLLGLFILSSPSDGRQIAKREGSYSHCAIVPLCRYYYATNLGRDKA